MDITKEDEQRQEFCNILFSLANQDFYFANADESTRTSIYHRLENLYHSPDKDKNYRHFYSDIFIVLTQIQQGDKTGSIDILGENLKAIRMEYEPINTDDQGNRIDIQESLKKLHDHVSLDIARINYSDAADRKVKNETTISKIRSELNVLKTDVTATKANVDASFDKAESLQKEYIAILGIFSSVVLTFTAGIAFSTSVLENIHQASIYRTVFVALVIGIVLINILYALFYYVDRLVHFPKKQSMKPLWIANGVILILMIATCIVWFLGTVESRNSAISSSEVDIAKLITSITAPLSSILQSIAEIVDHIAHTISK